MPNDVDFLSQFRACTLDPTEFGHRGHLRAAWLYLTQLPTPDAIQRLHADIRRYAESLGAAHKYHRTMTEAWMRLLASHLPRERHLSWQDLIVQHPIVVDDARGLLLRYYSEERLSHPGARTSYLSPDRRPLPVD